LFYRSVFISILILVGSKHFIIARVQTWDPKQPDKAFYSYYHAHHLNKTLFQTQVWLEKKLIHRLHVLNPLTNTDIIGNVLYFVVVRKTIKTPDGKETYQVFAPNQSEMNDSQMIPSQVRIVPSSSTPTAESMARIQDPILLNQAIHNHGGEDSDSVKKTNTGSEVQVENASNGWTITGNVTVEGAEDVVSRPSTGQQNRRMSIHSVVQSIQKALSPTKAVNFFRLKETEKEFDLERSEAELMDQTAIASSTSLRMNEQSKFRTMPLRVMTNFITAMGPNSASVLEAGYMPINAPIAGPLSAGAVAPRSPTTTWINQKARRFVPRGIITQHGEALTREQVLPLVKTNFRRGLSYLNSALASDHGSPTVEGWQKTLRRRQSSRIIEGDDGEEGGKLGPAQRLLDMSDSLDQYEVFYDAVLLATDNDFLESARVRTVFRENAVHESDSILFEMPPFTGQSASPEERQIPEQLPLPCDICFPSEAQLRHPNPWIRYYHRSKCYMLILLAMLIIVLVFYIPNLIFLQNRRGEDD
jgi:hypothetical protein